MPELILGFGYVLTFLVSFAIAVTVRFGGSLGGIANIGTTAAVTFGMYLGLLYYYDLFNHFHYARRVNLFFKFTKICLLGFAGYSLLGFVVRFHFLVESRVFVFTLYLALFGMLCLCQLLLVPRLLVRYFRPIEKRIKMRHIGPAEKYRIARAFFLENPVVGVQLYADEGEDPHPGSQTLLHVDTRSFGELYHLVLQHLPDGVVHVASPLFSDLGLRWEWARLGSAPVYRFCRRTDSGWRDRVRRLADIAVSAVALVVLAPLLALVAVLIKLDSRGPVIFKQQRVGKDQRWFTFYKFRSMHVRAADDEDREVEFCDYIEQKTRKGKVVKEHDVTRVGRMLRRTSIDELPQFYNVLKGDMALIGPRPPIPYEVKHYRRWHEDRLTIKPGLSGLWQIYGRGEMPCDTSMFLDIMYVINRSISLDLRLLMQTIPAVVLGRGAY